MIRRGGASLDSRNTPRGAPVLLMALAAGLAACGGGGGAPAVPVFANRVVAYAPEMTGVMGGIFVEANILGAPDGTTEVTSLGYDPAAAPARPGGSITVGMGAQADPFCIVDGAGDDFVVTENVFALVDSSGDANFSEAAYVEVSEDNSTFFRFAAVFPAADAALVGKPAAYSGLAGINVDGDGFDLGGVISANGLPATFSACYVRIVDGGTEVPDYDSHGELAAPATQDGSGADIDAVQALHAAAAPGL